MLASVEAQPRLVHADDLIDPSQPLHLPLLHCRECHSAAWGAMRKQGERSINPELQRFYAGWFAQSPDSVLLYPLVEGEAAPAHHSRSDEVLNLCTACCELRPAHQQQCQNCDQPMLKVWLPYLVKQVERQGQTQNIRNDDCPRCSAPNSLMILGSRAASLASVAISQIYGSHCNDDHKLIAFSDSVQDAAHRAGFFGARTYSQTVRQALAEVVRSEGDNMALSRFIDEVPRYWQRTFNDDASFVGTFIAPNMQWLSSYQQLLATQGAEVSAGLVKQVSQRLRWEALTELGLRSRIGRTLERSAIAVIQPDSSALSECARTLQSHWQEELEPLRDVRAAQVERFLLGVLHRLRQHGAFYDPVLKGYVRDSGTTFLLKRVPWLPGYGFSARPPAALTLTPVSSSFQNLVGRGSQWYQHWFNKTVASGDEFLASAEYEQAVRILLNVLTKGQWLRMLDTSKGESAWLLNTERWQVVTTVASFACDSCGHRQTLASQQQANWMTMPCMQASCQGHYAPANLSQQSQSMYRTLPKRLVTSEHTGLQEGKERLAIEQSFIYGDKAWDVNLLSATPTLEMGIDIGDLSAVLLCSVPPAQANYLQRIGRAGRSNGNALALTIANGNNHDNYFYSDPLEMIAGDVSTPGVFLNAMAVLERQLIAYCFDRWVATGVSEDAIAPTMGSILNSLQHKQSTQQRSVAAQAFPNNILSFIDEQQTQLFSRFVQLFTELDEEGQAHLRTFIGLQAAPDSDSTWHSTEQAGHTPLSWRIVNRLQELLDSRESHRKRAADLKRNYDALQKQPADPARDHLLEELKRERSALLALISSINKQPTLNFFTDEGLLPNYAFPEEGVTLNSVIVRQLEKKERVESSTEHDEVSYERVSLKFQRPAQAALNELVPNNVFYVSEHKINIEQVDLRLSEPSEWRMCPSCHYSEDVTLSGDKHSACPRCGDPYWADVQQKQNMLKLRQVYARANSRYDRISDDSDQREPKFFQRQLLIDIEPKNCSGAMRIDNPELPFAFEFVRTATFREVNFGEQFGEHNMFSVAGKNSSRTGFQICKHCGMVRRKKLNKGQFAHALDCRLSRAGAVETEEDWFESLYLFRELKSEAVRILLPLADVAETEKSRLSFIAAINLGLKEYFHGAVQHLEVTEMQEPSSTGNKQYLVIYDRIPGGTGYLKQLMTSSASLFRMLDKALHRLSTCSCVNDESKDGCYSCILAYRNSRHRQNISRQSAVELLSKILHNQDKLASVEGLSEVPTNSLLEGALEERFVHALAQTFTVSKQRVNNKAGYWLDIAGTTWELEPQVEFGKEQGVLETRADFVLRPHKQAARTRDNELIIYTDGFEYHWDKVTDDLRKRLSLLRSGRKVWVLTWDDLALDSTDKTLSMPQLLLECFQAGTQAQNLWNGLAKRHGWRNSNEIRNLLGRGSFTWLSEWLANTPQTRQALDETALCLSVLLLLPRPQLEAFVSQSVASTGEWREALLSALPAEAQNWQAVSEHAQASESAWQLLSYVAAQERSSLNTQNPSIHVLLSINDALAENNQTGHFKDKWRAIWQAFNVLQYAPSFSAVTQTGLQSGLFSPLLTESAAVHAEQAPSISVDNAWQDVRELTDLTVEHIQALQAMTESAPEVGVDLQDADGVTIGTAELAWQHLTVAVFVEPAEHMPELSGWQFISLASEDWLEQLKQALGKE